MTRTERGKHRFKNIKQQAVYDSEAAILELTEQVVAAMHKNNLKRIDLAKRMGTSKGHVTQLLDGPNFTFRTAALLSLAAGLRFHVSCEDKDGTRAEMVTAPKFVTPKTAEGAVVSFAKDDLAIETTVPSDYDHVVCS